MADTTTAAPAASSSAPSSAPDSSAASAPLADSSADASGYAQSTGDAESSTGAAVSPGSVGDSGEKFLELPDRLTDPEGFLARMNSLTDEEMDLFADGKVKTIEAAAKPEEKVEQKQEVPGQEKTATAEIEALSPEEFAKLPANVQKVIQTAQAKLDKLSEYEADLGPLLDPKARQELDSLLDDPRVRSVIEQRARGEDLSFDHESILTPENIAALVKDSGVSIDAFDGLTDPQGTTRAISMVVKKALQVGIDAGKLRSDVDAKNEARKAEYQNFFDSNLKGLTTKIDALKSNLDVNDPTHPVAPFVQHLQKLLGDKMISFDYLKTVGSLEPVYLAWQATQKGGVGALLKKPEANMRNRLVREMTEEVTKTAVNAAGRGVAAGSQDSNIQYGIDGQRYLSDESYRDQVLDQNGSNDKVMGALGKLWANGKW